MGFLDRFRSALAPAPVEQGPARDATISDPAKLRRSGNGGRNLRQSTSTLVNSLTGLGTERDPTFFNRFAIPRPLGDGERFGAGRNALIKQVLSKKADTATREGWRVEFLDERVLEPEQASDQITAYETRLDILTHTARANARNGQYGEAMILLGVIDGRGFDEPVDWDNVKTIKWAAVIDRRDYQPYKMFKPGSENFGKVETFAITDINGILEDGLRYGPDSVALSYADMHAELDKQQSGQIIFHADRVLHFPTEDYFSVLDTLQDSIGGYLTSMSGIATAARESSTVVYKIADWIRKQWSENYGLAQSHMQLIDRAKGSLGAWILDKDSEDVQVTNRSLGGVADLSNPFMVWLCAALGIPVTEFWGVSPGGFGKGDAERENWHATVRAFQRLVLTPRLMHLHRLMLVAEDGLQLPGDVARKINYEDLSPPDEKTRSELRSAALDDLTKAYEKQGITRDEYRAAVAQLNDDYFRLTLTKEGKQVTADALVGAISGTVEILKAVGLGEIPPESAEIALARLIPSSFDEETAALIMAPIKSRGTGLPPGTPQAAAMNPDEGAEPSDEEDGDQEPSEVDRIWSSSPLPADAMEAPQIAKALGGIPTVRITLAHKAGLIDGWDVLGGKPRYSLSEVKRVVLQGNGKMPTPEPEQVEPEAAADGKPSAVRDAEPEVYTAGIMLRAPADVARWVPYKPGEPSAPHVTLLYIGKIEPAKVVPVLDAVREVLIAHTPLEVDLGEVGYFDNDERVAFVEVRKTFALQALHEQLRAAVDGLGVEVKHRVEGFTPHLTLAYLAPGEDYSGPVPPYGWRADAVELWYDDLVLQLPLAPAAPASTQPAADEVEDALLRDLEAAIEAGRDADDFELACDGEACAAALEWANDAKKSDKKQERIDEAFSKFHEAVNMSASELERWAETEWSKKASLSREPITRNLRLLRKKKADWTLADATGAMRTVNFVSRMRGNERGKPVKIDGREGPSKRDISLKNWAFDPGK